jgi:epoxyqueuosine reductase
VLASEIKDLAHDCGFEIAGITAAEPHADISRFQAWAESGAAADLNYLTDLRGALRADPRNLLHNAQSIICLGKLYNTDRAFSSEIVDAARGWISRYAWGLDYHDVLRPALQTLVRRLTELRGAPFGSKICIDTAPLLERSYARLAGLGWIGKNTCLINQQHGSWFFLAELLVDFWISPDSPPPDRCGTCTRCIESCPTAAIVPNPRGGSDIDARLCISYLTIEKRGLLSSAEAALNGNHVFGCDICQDVCPWNHRAHLAGSDLTTDAAFASQIFAPDLANLSQLTEEEFGHLFRKTPIWRTKYSGFLRNVAIAMGNSGRKEMEVPLTRLATHVNETVSEAARIALAILESTPYTPTP